MISISIWSDPINFRPPHDQIADVNLIFKPHLFSKHFKGVFYFTSHVWMTYYNCHSNCGLLDWIITGPGRWSDPINFRSPYIQIADLNLTPSFRYSSPCLWNQLPDSHHPHANQSPSHSSHFTLAIFISTTITIHHSFTAAPGSKLACSTNPFHHTIPPQTRLPSQTLFFAFLGFLL